MPMLNLGPQTWGLLGDTLSGVGIGLLNSSRGNALGGVGQGLQYAQGLQQQRRINSRAEEMQKIAQAQLQIAQQQAQQQQAAFQQQQQQLSAQKLAAQGMFGGQSIPSNPMAFPGGAPPAGSSVGVSQPDPALAGMDPAVIRLLQRRAQYDPGGAIDLVTQQLLPKPADPSTNMKDYQFYSDQEIAKGKQPLGFNDWVLQQKRATANMTTINMPPAEKSYNTKLGEIEASEIGDLTNSANQSRGTLDALNTIDALRTTLQNTGNDVGALAPVKQKVGALANALGVQVGDLNSSAGIYEAMNAMTNKLTLSNIGTKEGMPANNFSNTDREFITKIGPQISDTPEGFAAKAEILRRTHMRNIQKEEMWNSGKYDQLSETDLRRFKQDWSKFVRENPLFTEQEKKNFAGLAAGAKVPPVATPKPAAPMNAPGELQGPDWIQ